MGHRFGTEDPTAINNSLVLAEEVQTWRWTKLVLGAIRRTKRQHLVYVKVSILSKFRSDVKLKLIKSEQTCK